MPEQVKIFSSEQEAENALPLGKPRRLVIDGKPLCIVRTSQGIYITDNECPHNRASLSEGWTNAFNQIICPLHEYRYDLRTGRESQQRCNDLRCYSVTTGDSGVYVDI